MPNALGAKLREGSENLGFSIYKNQCPNCWNIDKNNTQTIEDLVDEKTKIYNSIKVKSERLKDAPLKLDNINSVRLVLGCALNIKPIYKKTEIFYGFQEENKENYGKIFKLDF